MTPIPLATEPYWTYYSYLASLLDRLTVMAAGGQLVTRGTDIMSPDMIRQARETVSVFESSVTKIADVTASLKQNLGSASVGAV